MKLQITTFNVTKEDIIKTNLENIKMGIADDKIEGHANAYAVNNNKVEISQEVIIVLLVLIMLVALWKIFQNYIKRQIVANAVQNA